MRLIGDIGRGPVVSMGIRATPSVFIATPLPVLEHLIHPSIRTWSTTIQKQNMYLIVFHAKISSNLWPIDSDNYGQTLEKGNFRVSRVSKYLSSSQAVLWQQCVMCRCLYTYTDTDVGINAQPCRCLFSAFYLFWLQLFLASGGCVASHLLQTL